MKLKKLIAILASLSMLASSVTALAADTEPAPEAPEAVEEVVETVEEAIPEIAETAEIEEPEAAPEAEENAVEAEPEAKEEIEADMALQIMDGDPVAKVGTTEYATIEEAVAAWTTANNSTLTLLADVTLSDVAQVKSTEMHTLDLGTYTMTAASGKNAIQVLNAGRTGAGTALYVKADKDNPGGICAPGKSCIYYHNNNSTATWYTATKDRPIIDISGGVFSGAYCVYMNTKNGGTKSGQLKISGGDFTATSYCIYSDRETLTFSGGTFHSRNYISVDSTAYLCMSGGRYYDVSNSVGSNLYEGFANGGGAKWLFASTKNGTNYSNFILSDYNGDVYVDTEGYYIVTTSLNREKPGDSFKAALDKSEMGTNDSLYYSKVNADKKLYYESASVALQKNDKGKIYLYTDSDYNKSISGTLMIDCTDTNESYPENHSKYTGDVTLTSTNAKFIIYTNESNPYHGSVSTNIAGGEIHVEEETVAETGITTTTYTCVKNVKEEDAQAKIENGDSTKYYSTVYDAFYAADGTEGNTIVLLQDAPTATIITNGKVLNAEGLTDCTLDLNGHKFGLQGAGTGNQADFRLTVIDSSVEDGVIINDVAYLLKLAVKEYGDMSGKYSLIAKGGTWPFDPSKYEKDDVLYNFVASGYYARNNNDGTYTVLPANIEVIDNATETGVKVTLDELVGKLAEAGTDHEEIDVDAADTYEVVLGEPKSEVRSVVSSIVEQTETVTIDETPTEKNYDTNIALDISVLKTTSDGEKTYVEGYLTNQKVTVNLTKPVKAEDGMVIWHIEDDGTSEKIADKSGSADIPGEYELSNGGLTVTFMAPSFSAFVLKYNSDDVDPDTITDKVYVNFLPTTDERVYDIYVNAESDEKLINRLSAAELTFKLTVTEGTLSYEIYPASYVNLLENKDNDYEFNFEGVRVHDASGTSIKIGSVEFSGYGHLTFEVDDSADAVNIVNTAEYKDNIVVHNVAGGGLVLGDDIILDGKDYLGDIDATFAPDTKDLTINIKFNNEIEDNAAAYQSMKLVVSGGDLAEALEYDLGSDALSDQTYTVTVADTLTRNVAYTVAVSGDGYRTARYTVLMNSDKTLNFWNNVKDENHAGPIEEGVTGKDVTHNFLAGDIVKDNNINIYDLSAVVSYFGTVDITAMTEAEQDTYVKYDLNRDRKIDSKDIAYVLVSWGN